MKTTNTFGVHFILRKNKTQNGKYPVYARISVNKSRCELALKCYMKKEDWNEVKGLAKPKNDELKQLNTYFEEVERRSLTTTANLNGRKLLLPPKLSKKLTSARAIS
jgi:hypothetical protein